MKVEIEWIALDDELPKMEKIVLLTKRFGNFQVAFLSPEGDWWGENGRIEIKHFTHWAYLEGKNEEL